MTDNKKKQMGESIINLIKDYDATEGGIFEGCCGSEINEILIDKLREIAYDWDTLTTENVNHIFTKFKFKRSECVLMLNVLHVYGEYCEEKNMLDMAVNCDIVASHLALCKSKNPKDDVCIYLNETIYDTLYMALNYVVITEKNVTCADICDRLNNAYTPYKYLETDRRRILALMEG